MDRDKIREIMELLVPKAVSDVRSFMGITGYYLKLKEGFLRIKDPIMSLHKKGKRFVWDLKCEERFKKLKELLTTAPILKITDPNKNFVVCTDACSKGLVGVVT